MGRYVAQTHKDKSQMKEIINVKIIYYQLPPMNVAW